MVVAVALAGHLEGGVLGPDGWQVLAAAGAPRRRVVGGAGVVAVGWTGHQEGGVGGQGGWQVLVAAVMVAAAWMGRRMLTATGG